MGNLKEHVEEYKEDPIKFRFEFKINYKGEIFKFKRVTTLKGLQRSLNSVTTEMKQKIARKEICLAYDLGEL